MPEATAAAAAGDVVKTEPKEDPDVAPKKKKDRPKKDAKDEAEEGTTARKKDEDDEAGEEGNEEDAMAPEAEPTHPRSEVPADAKFREDAVHVYGLDFLKTGHMEEIFGQFNHRFIEWINDSSANVVFRDAASARKALESLSYPKAGDDPWRRTPDILVQDDLPAVFLQMRLAAPSDCKRGRKAVPSVNPPTYQEEPDRRRPGFTVASLYDKREKQPRTGTGKKRGTPQPLPEAEVTKRAKRAERFEATLGDPPAPEVVEPPAPASAAPETDAAAPKAATPGPTPEQVAEEKERRDKRAARFATETDKKAEGETGKVTVSEDSAAPAEADGGADAAAPAAEAPAAGSPEAA